MLSEILALLACLESIKIYIQNIKVIVKRIISKLDHSEYSHPLDKISKINDSIKTAKPNKINPFGIIKWSISTKVTAIRR